MMDHFTSDFRVVRLDDVPLLFALLQRMKVASLLDQLVPQPLNWAGALSFGQVVVGWQVYILRTSDQRLNQVQEGVAQRWPGYSSCLGQPVRARDFSDDRLAYVLERLQATGCWSPFETLLNQRLIRVYDLPAQRVRLTPTTLSTDAPVRERGLLQLGHSKDGRAGEAQLKIQRGVLAPRALPLVTPVVAGNSAEAPLYGPALTQVQASRGVGGKTAIGDSQLGARAPRAQRAAARDFYRCPRGDKQLRKAARAALRRAALRGAVKLQPLVQQRLDARGINPPVSAEIAAGDETRVRMKARQASRVVRWSARRRVIRAPAYARGETAALDQRRARAQQELAELAVRKQGKRRLDKPQTRAAADQSRARHRVADLLRVQVKSQTTRRAVRSYKERPDETRSATVVQVRVARDETAREEVKERLGWRIYATNDPDLTVREAVLAYREQDRIEDGLSRLKGRRLGLAPMLLQTEARLTGLIYLLTMALRVLTLVEFQVRRALPAAGKTLKGVYAGPPGRQTARPSTELRLAAFRGIDAACGTIKDTFVTYLRPLTEAQKCILRLLELDALLYEKLLPHFQNLAPE